MKLEMTDQAKAMVQQMRQAAEQAAQAAAQNLQQQGFGGGRGPANDPRMAQRYGLAPPPEAEPDASREPSGGDGKIELPGGQAFDVGGEGNWRRKGRDYSVSIRGQGGQSRTVEATSDGEILRLVVQGQPLVFVRTLPRGA